MKISIMKNECCSFSRIAPKRSVINKLVKRSYAVITVLTLMTLGFLLAGCGGGSEGASSQVVSGTVAVSAPLSGQAGLKDSSRPQQQKTTVIGSDGSFAIDVIDMKAPYLQQATGSAEGTGTVAYPTGVAATGGSNQVSLSWSAVPGATSYNIYYETTSGVTKTSGAKITNVTSPHVQTGLAAVTTYYFIVTAVNSIGEGAASSQASATTNAAPPVPACGSCHAIPPAIGKHSTHAFTSCATCHGAGYSISTVNESTHLNGIKNVGAISGWNETERSCSNSCHGTRSW